MNIIFKVIMDALFKQSEKEAREKEARAAGEAQAETRQCPVCQAEAGEQDTECPQCGARLN